MVASGFLSLSNVSDTDLFGHNNAGAGGANFNDSFQLQ